MTPERLEAFKALAFLIEESNKKHKLTTEACELE
jgi:hypothetical protein